MSKKLYWVELEYSGYVMAEDLAEAHRVAKSEIPFHEDPDITATEETGKRGIMAGWSDSIPHGSDNDKEVSEIFKEMKGES